MTTRNETAVNLNKPLLFAMLLIMLSQVPNGIAVYEFMNTGGLNFPMVWGNERIAWSAIFSIFALLGALIALIKKNGIPKRSAILVVVASIVVIFSIYELFSRGIGPSSKGDDKELRLIEFWSE